MLVAGLAIVLTGKGIAELQKVGIFDTTSIAIPRVDLLGIYLTVETVAAQAAILSILIAAFYFNLRFEKRAQT